MVKNNSNEPYSGENDDLELSALNEQLFLENSAIVKQSLENIDESIVLPASLRGSELLKKHAEEIALHKSALPPAGAESTAQQEEKASQASGGENVIKVNFSKKTLKYLAVACTFLVALTVLFNQQNLYQFNSAAPSGEAPAVQYNELRSVLGTYSEEKELSMRSQQQFASPIVGAFPESGEGAAPGAGGMGDFESGSLDANPPTEGAGMSNPTTGGSGGVTSSQSEDFYIPDFYKPTFFAYDNSNIYTYKSGGTADKGVVTVENLENGNLTAEITLQPGESVVNMFAEDNKLILINSSYLGEEKTGDKSIDGLAISDLTAAMFTEFNASPAAEIGENSPGIVNPSVVGGNYFYPITKVDVYDITAKPKPQLMATYVQDGYYRESFYSNGSAYLVTDKFIDSDARKDDALAIDIIPFYSSDGQNFSLVAENDMEFMTLSSSPLNFTVMSQTNVNNPGEQNVKAVLTSSSMVYEGENGVVLSCEITEKDGQSRTTFLKFEDNKLVKGTTLDGYIMGKVIKTPHGFMALSITLDKDYNPIGNFYMLDDNLNKISQIDEVCSGFYISALELLSPNSVMFSGGETSSKPYYIDIKNPKAPKLVGQLDLDVYAGAFTKLADNTYLKVSNGGENGTRLVQILDMSDVLQPKILATATGGENNTGNFLQAYFEQQANGDIYIVTESYSQDEGEPIILTFYRYSGEKLEMVKEETYSPEAYYSLFISKGNVYLLGDKPVKILNF